MWFRQLVDNDTQALTYLLGDPASGETLVLDPQPRDWALVQALVDEFGGHIRAVLLTHNHSAERLGRLLALKRPLLLANCWHNLPPDTAWPTHEVTFGQERVRVLATPGHTIECTSFLWQDRLFCGDVLDVSVCPDQPWPTHTALLWESLQRQVLSLPGDTLLYPAHTTQGRSVLNLHDYPHLATDSARLRSRDAFLAALEHAAPSQVTA